MELTNTIVVDPYVYYYYLSTRISMELTSVFNNWSIIYVILHYTIVV